MKYIRVESARILNLLKSQESKRVDNKEDHCDTLSVKGFLHYPNLITPWQDSTLQQIIKKE